MAIFDQAHPKIFSSTFSFPGFVPACKKSVVPSVHFWDAVNFRVQRPDWPHSFLTIPNQEIFDQLSIFVNLYQHAKNEAVSSIFSGEMVPWKIEIFAGTQQIIKSSTVEQILWKLMTKFFFKFEKTYFWLISPIFWAKVFPKNLALSRTTWSGFLAPWWNSEKPNDPIEPNDKLGETAGGKDVADPIS